jgi:hypothetical protein
VHCAVQRAVKRSAAECNLPYRQLRLAQLELAGKLRIGGTNEYGGENAAEGYYVSC